MTRSQSIAASVACALAFVGSCRDPEPPAARVPEKVESPVAAAGPELNLDERGRALRGYDPVAYFTESQAIPGQADLREVREGAEYLFANEAHREAFRSQPERYQPAHGGFCTFGIVMEKKFDGDPEVWMVHDDQLHVFLNEEVRDKFLSDEEANFARVEANWPRIRDRTAQELEEASVLSAGIDD